MAKLVNYRCQNCETDIEELFMDTETPPDYLDVECPECGGKKVKIFNLKNNQHRWDYNDRGGI